MQTTYPLYHGKYDSKNPSCVSIDEIQTYTMNLILHAEQYLIGTRAVLPSHPGHLHYLNVEYLSYLHCLFLLS